jgi:hydroxymethylglutaryl-CoA lyase
VKNSAWPSEVLIVDVSPRDGLQNDSADLTTAQKVELIDGLVSAGVKRVECTSFVSPKAVPKMADADAVAEQIRRRPGHQYACLVANVRGMQRALDAQMDVVNVVVVASETFNRRNAGMSVEDSLDGVTQISRDVTAAGAIPSVVVGTAFHCPFEGPTPPEKVLAIVQRCVDAGTSEVTLADTNGAADPGEVERLGELVKERWPNLALGLHLHDTRGLALANAAIGLRAGFSRFEVSLGGVGGCPFSPGATGNGSTEDLVFMLESMGIKTGIELGKLLSLCGRFEQILGRKLATGLVRAGPRSTVPA